MYSLVSGHPWDEARSLKAAAEGGHLSCVKYAHENDGAYFVPDICVFHTSS